MNYNNNLSLELKKTAKTMSYKIVTTNNPSVKFCILFILLIYSICMALLKEKKPISITWYRKYLDICTQFYSKKSSLVNIV